MAKFCFLLLSVLSLGAYGEGDTNNDVRLRSEDANNFINVKTRIRRGIYHECYYEGCGFEEVSESISPSSRAYEYFYTYTCAKFGRNCKVPCSYREDCSFGNWGGWRGDVKAQTPGCYPQTRAKPYNHPLQKTSRRFNCNGLNTNCRDEPVQKRQQCVCRKANCQAGSWKQWSGDIKDGSCGMQIRSRPYVLTWSLKQRAESCHGIQTMCPLPDSDFRKMCRCSKADCTLEDWGEWEGAAKEGTCTEQKRTREYTKSVIYESHTKECPNLPQQCPPEANNETRTMCSCKYATCTLGNWSEWEPKEMKGEHCGHQQTRRKTFSLKFAYQVHTEKCPSLPQTCPDDIVENRTQCKCAYRDSCKLSTWSEWDKPLTEEGCELQTRKQIYFDPLKYSLQEDCSGLLTSCITEPEETRNFCKCKNVECNLGEWSDWSSTPNFAAGQCGTEKRTREYIGEEKFIFGETCNDNTTCPPGQEETRTMCKCPYVTCNISYWNAWAWQGKLPEDGCAQQRRTKTVTPKNHEKIQAESCDGLQTTCPFIPPETRQWCNCSFREDCVLNNWSEWEGKLPDVGCADQIRTRDYNKSVEWIERDTCDGLESCPVIREETRTNYNLFLGNWTRTSFNSQTNCYVEVRVKNDSSGFKKVEQAHSCDRIPIECSDNEKEERKDCVGGSDGKTTSAPTGPSVTTVAPTTEPQPATFVYLGCFKDSSKPRPLPIMIANKRGGIDWHNLKKTVQACAEVAKKQRLEYFSVQFYGECWSGKDAGETFARDGPSKECYAGVGKKGINAVYRIEDLPACSSELSFNAAVSTGKVKDQEWCAGDAAEYQWITADLEGERQISGIGTQGADTKDNWVTLYTLEWSKDGEAWETYQEDGQDKVFTGNSDRFTLENRWLKSPITAGFLRFKPKSWTSTHVCMKIRIYGCDAV
ncbi:hypothetical protein OS493_000885 [Desmophyllum pertusum]|uniref:F5/8 type C domain-containing protein n=1 Tax=Desmophyllum pertusum TaxID=174260 RepID=A0A9X0D7A9_9CNID|nr:hypothetical protein OS493_000885 [Desmophyllum pertusum]